MITFDEALGRILRAAVTLPSERVALGAAEGRVLARALTSNSPLPPFDYSAMDGYAISTGALDGSGPWTLAVRGESKAGNASPELAPGTACRIFTGAPIPTGADAIIMQEDVQRDGDAVTFAERPQAFTHVRRAGEDLEAGAEAAAGGTRIRAFELGLIASLDLADVDVRARPRVSMVSTGDELRAPGGPPRSGSIPESNGVALAALARGAGAQIVSREICPDDPFAAKQIFARALGSADVVVSVGGVSVGDYDIVRPTLEALGVTIDLYKVAMKPGKPFTLGSRGDVRVLGLPGNPVSAQVTFALLGIPMLRQMQGDLRATAPRRRATLTGRIEHKPGRLGFYPAMLDGDRAAPGANRASGATTSLARANGLVVVPVDVDGLEAGASVEVIRFDEL